MPVRYRSEQLVSRLRAHKLVPSGVAVVIRHLSGPSRHHDGSTLLWQAVNAVTGEPLGVASAYTMEQVARCPDWLIGEQDGLRLVTPGSQEAAP